MKAILTISAMILLATTVLAETVQQPDDNLKMHDADFTLDGFEEAIRHLHKISMMMWEAKLEIVRDPVFYIGYPNSLKKIEGYVLKQAVELAKTYADLVDERFKEGKATASDLKTVRQKKAEAEQAYKRFLETAYYDD